MYVSVCVNGICRIIFFSSIAPKKEEKERFKELEISTLTCIYLCLTSNPKYLLSMKIQIENKKQLEVRWNYKLLYDMKVVSLIKRAE